MNKEVLASHVADIEAGMKEYMPEENGYQRTVFEAVNYSLLAGGFIDEVYSFIAPKIVGGEKAKTPVEGVGIEKMADAVTLERTDVLCLGQDILVKLKVKN